MLDAMRGGQRDPEVRAELAPGPMRGKLPDLRLALEGRVHPYHLFLLRQILAHMDFLEHSLAQLQQELEARLVPCEEAVTLIQSLPVVLQAGAATVVAEMGGEMSRFPSAKHLASWAGLCPGHKQSGGKRLNGAPTQGNTYLRAVLSEMAWVVSHTKDNDRAAHYHRLARRRGKKRAIGAVAHSLLVIISHMLHTKKPYTDLGAGYFDHLDTARVQRRAVQRLEQLGYEVSLTPQQVA
jgi:transposase